MRTLLAAVSLLLAGSAAAAPPPADFAQQVAAVESARGLVFVRAPALVRVPAGAPFEAALAALPDRLAIACPTAGFDVRPVETTAADPASDRVLATPDASAEDVRVALAHLLDAQHHPALVQTALQRSGDAGVAQRGLLAASACATAQGGLGPPQPVEPGDDPFAGSPSVALEATPDALRLLRTPTLVATTFLRRLPDREAAFRRPPLSTLELLVPGRWEAGAPVELVGAPPDLPGCRPARDESLGVLAMIRALVAAGGDVPRGAFVGWRGDRLVVFACDDERTPWLYVAQLDRKRDADDLAGAAGVVLPAELPRPLAARAAGRRVLAWHGVDEAPAAAFATALQARPLR